MIHIFYFFTFIFIIDELKSLINTKLYLSEAKDLNNKINNLDTSDRDSIANISTKDLKEIRFSLFYFLWCVIGLFSFQWYTFATILLLSMLPIMHNRFLHKKIDSLLTLIILFFIIINQYHLQLDLTEFIQLFR